MLLFPSLSKSVKNTFKNIHLGHKGNLRFDLRNNFFQYGAYSVLKYIITVTQKSNLGVIKHYECQAPHQQESNLISQGWDPVMGIFMKVPQMILMQVRAIYQ